nr:hypothetical protein [Agrobacterium tumefaciens]
MKHGITRAFWARLRYCLAAGTPGGVRSFSSGFVTTVVLRSSTATTLIVTSFSKMALIVPSMTHVVMPGPNLGTAITVWIVARVELCLP